MHSGAVPQPGPAGGSTENSQPSFSIDTLWSPVTWLPRKRRPSHRSLLLGGVTSPAFSDSLLLGLFSGTEEEGGSEKIRSNPPLPSHRGVPERRGTASTEPAVTFQPGIVGPERGWRPGTDGEKCPGVQRRRTGLRSCHGAEGREPVPAGPEDRQWIFWRHLFR